MTNSRREFVTTSTGWIFPTHPQLKDADDGAKKFRDAERKYATGDVEKMLLGNNCDMNDKRQVSKEEGEQIAELQFAVEYGMKVMEVSARASINIEEAIFTLARKIMNKKEGATGSGDCTHEDGSDKLRLKNSCVVL